MLLLPSTTKRFPDPRRVVTGPNGFVGFGASLHPDLLLDAYAKGYFPWSGEQPIPWFSTDPRLVLDPRAFRATRSLRKVRRQGRYEITVDAAFTEVMARCAEMPREGQGGTWINGGMFEAWTTLHQRGFSHSVEVWTPEGCAEAASSERTLVGGLYGLAIGRMFFGESMFSAASNASKLALWHLCERLAARNFALIDCQQDTPHLRSLGAVTIPRAVYLDRLDDAVGATVGDPRAAWAREPVAKALPASADDVG